LLASAGEWVVSKITATVAVFTRAEIGTASVSNGLEMKDSATGETYCVRITNGEWDKQEGNCNTQAPSSNNQTDSTTTPSVNSNTNVADTEPPVITINGNNPANVEVGAAYADLGATVFDAGSPNIGVHTFGLEAIDTSTTTSYVVTYTATDQAGNTATTTRQVIVGEPTTNNQQPTTEESPIEPTTNNLQPTTEGEETNATSTPPTEPTPEPIPTPATEE